MYVEVVASETTVGSEIQGFVKNVLKKALEYAGMGAQGAADLFTDVLVALAVVSIETSIRSIYLDNLRLVDGL